MVDEASCTAMIASGIPRQEIYEVVDPTSWMTAGQKALLNHFVLSASQITSCHPSLQDEYCRTLLPMAVQTPSLFSAVMALSQTHREAGIEIPAPDGQMSLVQSFRGASIQSLSKDLEVFDVRTAEASLATILTLCLCEIHAGSYESKSWRVHFDGARAVLAAISRSSGNRIAIRGSTLEFLERWYISIEALAALTAKGLPRGQLKGSDGAQPVVESQDGIYIDDYIGFSTDLIPVFREIGAAAWEQRRRDAGSPEACRAPQAEFDEEIEVLETSIRNMITRDIMYPPSFYPGVREKLSENQIEDYCLVNRTYQHAALIHLYRRVQKLARTSPQVQNSVKAILDCANRITLTAGLSPWIVLATPLFTAGCDALGNDRLQVADLFQQLYTSLRIRNMLRGLEVLHQHWDRVDAGSQDWSALQGLFSYSPPHL